jgi:cyclohexa-1,5-dienecarbonyl-CoA hydratase
MMLDTRVDAGIATVVLNHPPLNVLTRALLGDLRASLAKLGNRGDVRVLVLASTGKHFSAGADVEEHLPPAYQDLIPEFIDTIETVASFPLPTIAAVRGRCLGAGFELVQAADLIVAGEGAMFGQPEILLGVTAPAACALLPRRASPGLAAEILFTGDPISARRALESGLIQRVVPDGDVEAQANALAARCARHSAPALYATKRTLLAAARRSRAEGLRAAAAIYRNELMEASDAVEGLRAFLEKRTPVWEHR